MKSHGFIRFYGKVSLLSGHVNALILNGLSLLTAYMNNITNLGPTDAIAELQ